MSRSDPTPNLSILVATWNCAGQLAEFRRIDSRLGRGNVGPCPIPAPRAASRRPLFIKKREQITHELLATCRARRVQRLQSPIQFLCDGCHASTMP